MCKKAVKKLGSRAANASEESILCSSTWQKGVWDKQLHCQAKLVSLHCAALESLFGIFEHGKLHACNLGWQSLASIASVELPLPHAKTLATTGLLEFQDLLAQLATC